VVELNRSAVEIMPALAARRAAGVAPLLCFSFPFL
jgi:hypothetical protein